MKFLQKEFIDCIKDFVIFKPDIKEKLKSAADLCYINYFKYILIL